MADYSHNEQILPTLIVNETPLIQSRFNTMADSRRTPIHAVH